MDFLHLFKYFFLRTHRSSPQLPLPQHPPPPPRPIRRKRLRRKKRRIPRATMTWASVFSTKPSYAKNKSSFVPCLNRCWAKASLILVALGRVLLVHAREAVCAAGLDAQWRPTRLFFALFSSINSIKYFLVLFKNTYQKHLFLPQPLTGELCGISLALKIENPYPITANTR